MRTAVIIGATSGIGRTVAEKLLREGWRVVVTGRRVEALERIRSEHARGSVVTYPMDVTQESASEILCRIVSEVGMPQLLMYVSGVGYQNRMLDMDKELGTVRTNCEGMVRILSCFLDLVRKAASNGTISMDSPVQVAVVSSVAGTKGLGTAPAYSATKKMQSTYVSALSQLARMEKLPVEFTDIRPGFVTTEILDPSKHYPMAISARKAAEYIVKGLKRRRRVIVFDWRFRIVVLLWRLIPDFIWERITIVKN